MKTWPIDPLGLRNIQLEVSTKLQQGKLACGSQAFIATLLCGSFDVGSPIIRTQKSQSVGLFAANKERELALDRPETG